MEAPAAGKDDGCLFIGGSKRPQTADAPANFNKALHQKQGPELKPELGGGRKQIFLKLDLSFGGFSKCDDNRHRIALELCCFKPQEVSSHSSWCSFRPVVGLLYWIEDVITDIH